MAQIPKNAIKSKFILKNFSSQGRTRTYDYATLTDEIPFPHYALPDFV